MFKHPAYYSLALLFCICVSFAANNNHTTFNYEVKGVHGDLLKNVVARLKIAEQDVIPPLTKKNVHEFYDDSPDNIRQALMPYGYFKPKIKSSLKFDGRTWRATYYINAGRAVKITNIQFTITGPGRGQPAFRETLRNMPIRKRQILLTESYNKALKSFIDAAQKLGYMDAKFSQHVIKVDLSNYTANIILHFNTGPRYYFGRISFSKSPFSTRFLKGYIPFKYGAPYTTDDLLLFQSQLGGSGYFQHVSVVPDRKRAKQYRVPVHVKLVPRKSQHYSIGLGYSTDTQLRGSLGVEWRYLNPRGHHFQALLQGSSRKSNLQARYIIPGRNPVTDQYNITAALLTNDTPDGKSLTAPLLGVSYLKTQHEWQRTLGIHYQHERFEFDGEPKRSTDFIIPSVAWQKITTDDRINATEGYRIFINLQGGVELSSSDSRFIKSTFVQGEFQGKLIHSLNKKNRIVLRTDLGATILVRNGFHLPLTQYFYAGGANSIRGFNYQELGRGRYLIVGSAEYQHFLHGNWGVATFIDIGNAFTHTPIKLRKGVGVGLLYRSPIGPIEVTVASGGKLNGGFHGIDVQFTMGPDF